MKKILWLRRWFGFNRLLIKERLRLMRIRDAVADYDYHEDRGGVGWYKIQKALCDYDDWRERL